MARWQVVRGAAPEVDRRAAPRVALPRLARLELTGHPPAEARLVDISIGDALILAASPLPPAAPGMLQVAGIALPLPFTLLGGDTRDGQRLRFGLDAAGSTALERLLEGLAQAPAARRRSSLDFDRPAVSSIAATCYSRPPSRWSSGGGTAGWHRA